MRTHAIKVFLKPFTLLLMLSLLIAPAPAAAAPAGQGSGGCAFASYSLPVWSALRFFNGSQVVLLSQGAAADQVRLSIDGVEYGSRALPLNLGSIAAVMDYRAHLGSWMGKVRTMAQYKPRIDACLGWAVEVVAAPAVGAASADAASADAASADAVLSIVKSGEQLPAHRAATTAPALPAVVNGAPFFAPQLAAVTDADLLRPLAPVPAATAAAAQVMLPVAALEKLASEHPAQGSVAAASAEAASAWYVFQPYNFNNYYRSITSQSNFNYLNLWRGWNINQILGYTDRFIGNVLRNPYIWRSVVASAAAEAAPATTRIDMAPVGLGVLNGISGATGNWNQFEGQQPYPDFGDDQQTTQGSLVAAAVLGYDSTQARTFGDSFQAELNSLLSPWSSYAPWLAPAPRHVAASAAQTDSGPFDERYRAIGQLQADTYSTDSSLSALRTESNQVSIGLIYLDPYYVYYTLELNKVWQSIFTTRPHYTNWLAVQQEIATWRDAPTDTATLQQRYAKRQELTQWYYVVYYESLLYLLQPENQATLQWVVDTYAYLQSLAKQIWSSDWAMQWSSQWSQDWDNTHQRALTASDVRPAMEKLLQEEPSFREYLELNHDVSTLVADQFADHPAVQEVSANIAAVLQDNNVTQSVNDAYQDYQQALGSLLGQTNFTAELERYAARVNASESQNLSYDKLVLRYEQVAAAFSQYQLRIHNAVVACWQSKGSACNAYEDATVNAILAEPNTVQTLQAVGKFYEEARLYWYNFHRGDAYHNVETESSAAMQTALNNVSAEIGVARTDFMATVNSVPEINSLNRGALDMLATLRGQSTDGGLAVTSAASRELDQMLQRMSELTVALKPSNLLYLPAAIR
jgi:hypothetical protein